MHPSLSRPRRRVALALLVGAALTAAASPALARTATTKAAKAAKTTKAPATTRPSAATTAPAPTAAPPTAAAAATTLAPVTVAPGAKPVTGRLRLGYFPNVTHAAALVAVEKGFFKDALGPDVKLETATFNAGPPAIEALFSGAIDATYVGPNPAVNAFVQSKGAAVRIISGATSGGAFLVVKKSIGSAADLKGKKIASPQLGGTQDVALRYWLKTKGLSSTLEGGGDVSVVPQENAQTLQTFRSGAIDGAWVPEPWATRLILEGGGRALVDERDLWPNQSFTTTILIVRTEYLKDNPQIVERLLAGHLAATDYLRSNPDKAIDAANAAIEKITGAKLAAATINSAWVNLTFTNDPEISTIRVSAEHATEIGLLSKVDLKGIEDLTLLNKVLAANGRPNVTD